MAAWGDQNKFGDGVEVQRTSKDKDEIRGFFPFGKLRVRMTNVFDDSIAFAKRL